MIQTLQVPIMNYVIFFMLNAAMFVYIAKYWTDYISKALKEAGGTEHSLKRHVVFLFTIAFIEGMLLLIVNVIIPQMLMGSLVGMIGGGLGIALSEKLGMKKLSNPPVPEAPTVVNTGNVIQQNNAAAPTT